MIESQFQKTIKWQGDWHADNVYYTQEKLKENSTTEEGNLGLVKDKVNFCPTRNLTFQIIRLVAGLGNWYAKRKFHTSCLFHMPFGQKRKMKQNPDSGWYLFAL